MKMNLIKMDLMKKKKRKGFTLIELIVVIAIIGILAAIAIPKFAGMTDTAKKQACAADAKTALTALTTMYAQDPALVSTSTTQIDPGFVKLAGTLSGTLAITAISTDGDFTFTYAVTGHTTRVIASVIGATS